MKIFTTALLTGISVQAYHDFGFLMAAGVLGSLAFFVTIGYVIGKELL